MLSAGDVARHLPYEACIPLIRKAMIALSQGRTRQLLRGIIDLEGGNAFGVMPGTMLDSGAFSAKLVGVYPGNSNRANRRIRGSSCFSIPKQEHRCVSRMPGRLPQSAPLQPQRPATDVLSGRTQTARHSGYGEQAWPMSSDPPYSRRGESEIWGRSAERAQPLRRGSAPSGSSSGAPDMGSAVASADIICSLTAAADRFSTY